MMLIIETLFALKVIAQSKKTLKQQKEYQSAYEGSKLTETSFPMSMPFNRIIDPAGEQIYFGDEDKENHALDCAASPDGKWLAIEGRFSIVIVEPESKQIVSRFVLKKLFWERGCSKYLLGNFMA